MDWLIFLISLLGLPLTLVVDAIVSFIFTLVFGVPLRYLKQKKFISENTVNAVVSFYSTAITLPLIVLIYKIVYEQFDLGRLFLVLATFIFAVAWLSAERRYIGKKNKTGQMLGGITGLIATVILVIY